ncbi:hypothetical protein H0A36_28285 [Endozoicomonas sp. SM1973]|uniref:Single-stranded DNA-binding protein BPT7 domain-containing protein n=1 Tax=Spartinivicinus marinus TaxID=2994442 RepID=A0A853IKM5_9GAMM|nr:hypothetical protein [Spartinivicinus marinus]MCX4025652.1 hypothetical protein [Spartinivicinus marinus]NYZ69917.1 hypothetical protein [Spartinivicinus marinus]
MTKETYISPLGTLGPFPRLNKPDTKFNADGEYKAQLVVPAEDAQKLIDRINKQYEEFYNELTEEERKKKKKPKLKLKKADLPYEVDEDEGTVTFKYKLKALIKKKDGTIIKRRPIIYDSKGKKVPEVTDIFIGQGSEIKISTLFYTWYTPTLGAGITLQFDAVQVIKLENKAYSPDASSFGFVEHEDGFSIEDQAPFDTDEDDEEPEDSNEEEDDGDF